MRDEAEDKALLTLGDLDRHPRFQGYTRRQIDYAIQQAGIEPFARLGIIRAFRDKQIEEILAALERTARQACRQARLSTQHDVAPTRRH